MNDGIIIHHESLTNSPAVLSRSCDPFPQPNPCGIFHFGYKLVRPSNPRCKWRGIWRATPGKFLGLGIGLRRSLMHNSPASSARQAVAVFADDLL